MQRTPTNSGCSVKEPASVATTDAGSLHSPIYYGRMKARTPRYLKVGVVRVAIVTLLVFALLYQFSRGDESSNHLRQSSVAVQHESRREFFRTLALHHSPDQRQVVDMAKHAWKGYRRWGDWSDYLDVTRKEPGTAYSHDLALTAVDALDTLFILGLHDEFDEASAWVKANLDDTMFYPGVVSFFEVTIRSLGGLLSAYYLSGASSNERLSLGRSRTDYGSEPLNRGATLCAARDSASAQLNEGLHLWQFTTQRPVPLRRPRGMGVHALQTVDIEHTNAFTWRLGTGCKRRLCPRQPPSCSSSRTWPARQATRASSSLSNPSAAR